MKKLTKIFLLTMFSVALLNTSSNAQVLKAIKSRVKNTVESKMVNKVDKSVDKTIDKALGDASEDLNSNNGEGSDSEESKGSSNDKNSVKTDYKSYDFVPGDKIIFQPDLSGESDAELPARFAIKKGNAEIQSYEGEKILHLDQGGHLTVTPLMNSEEYLPEQFTIEFDMMYENDKDYFNSVNDFDVNFFKAEEQNWDMYPLFRFRIHSNERTSLGNNSGQVVPDALKKQLQTNNIWHHIAIYVRKNIAKAYINQYRVAASNTMPTGAGKLALTTDGNYGFKIKNVRIAAGGDDKYNKIVTDGKFITHGIQFDVAKATLKPESMGTINEVAKLMNDHDDLTFEIQGHTDSDGSDDLNLTLSQQRADSVKEKLIQMGVEESRLSTKGYGESRPLESNDTAEGKANNRRVEFVKM